MLHSYPSIYALGHRYLEHLFDDPVVVQEKIDGSQFSFGLVDGEIQCRSKGQNLVMDAPEKMFVLAVETVKSIGNRLVAGLTYRAEFLRKPKHNTLAYSRVPKGNLILYDVMRGEQDYAPPDQVQTWAEGLGLEVVPTYFEGMAPRMDFLQGCLTHESVLGGTPIEGVVVKSYTLFGPDKKPLMAKLVRADFQEQNMKAWRASNPTHGDVVDRLIARYHVDARFQKAVQRLKESGSFTQSPQDIGPLLQALEADLAKEETEEIKEALFKAFWPQIVRGVRAGLPEWYKKQLAEDAMSNAIQAD